MSRPGDDVGDMGMTELPDEAIEAFFLGEAHGAWEQDEGLVGLVDEVMTAASGPAPHPGPALHAFLGEPGAEAAPPPGATQPRPASPFRQPGTVTAPPASAGRSDNVIPLFRRLRPAVGVAAAAAVAAVALTVAGTTGTLPEPAMRAVAWVVEAVTPFELPEPDGKQRGPEGVPDPPVSTVPPAPPAETLPPGRDVRPEQPAITRPATPGPSIPAGIGPGQPPGAGADQNRQTPTGPSIPLGPLPPAGVAPPGGGGNSPLSTTPVDPAGQPSPSSTGPPVVAPQARR